MVKKRFLPTSKLLFASVLLLPLLLTACGNANTSQPTNPQTSVPPQTNQPENNDPNSDNNSNNENNNNPDAPQTNPNQSVRFQTWDNNQLQANKFATVASNGKLDIVPLRGADDIKDADFNDGRVNTPPLQGVLPNTKYVNLAKISYSVNFQHGSANFLGTSWLLDFMLPENVPYSKAGNSYTADNYPTKWYFATNAHVMDDLKTNHSIISELNSQKLPFTGTTTVKLTKLTNPTVGSGVDDGFKKSSFNNPAYTTYSFPLTDGQGTYLANPAVQPVFIGFNYLQSAPHASINNVPKPDQIPPDVVYTQTEETADFAVFEIDFEKVTNIPPQFGNSPHKYAQAVTNDYANWNDVLKYKIPNQPLVNQANFSQLQFYALGFPEQSVLTGGGLAASEHVALYINQPSTLAAENYEQAGAKLVKNRYYNTFQDAAGFFDLTIGSADFGYKFNPISNTVVSSGIIPYLYQGLAWTDQNGDMHVGSSGSVFVDENNYIHGIHFASDFTAHVGINFALQADGYDYQNAYGFHQLQGYDLISGGFENQTTSFREQLLKLYPETTKTYLFQNTLARKHVS